MKKVLQTCKDEIVLTAAAILAILSAFWVHPDAEYLGYVDFRTLSLLFCLMAVMGGFQRIGVFRAIAQALLKKVGKSSVLIVLVLVLLAFFFSMLITNDVGLITFVPFTFTVLELLGEKARDRLVVPVITLETIGANLGSMLTPIGNPQNLYLYGKAGLSVGSFLLLMLPYTLVAGVLLIIWSITTGVLRGTKAEELASALVGANAVDKAVKQAETEPAHDEKKKVLLLVLYVILFALSLLTVAKKVPFPVTLGVTFVCIALLDRKTLGKVDYFLLLTFTAFFIFIGNMGRIPAFSNFLAGIVNGREVPVGICASQVISNVPAALLLSGFSKNYHELIIGVNLGGLGTLIASMASLISYKNYANAFPERKGSYLLRFTGLNVLMLI
ncbi:MAG: citrate transporter, partial [Lachnospiraceae bacterium]|nr:citrate transporter [Lachnospiraceae bacterium]